MLMYCWPSVLDGGPAIKQDLDREAYMFRVCWDYNSVLGLQTRVMQSQKAETNTTAYWLCTARQRTVNSQKHWWVGIVKTLYETHFQPEILMSHKSALARLN